MCVSVQYPIPSGWQQVALSLIQWHEIIQKLLKTNKRKTFEQMSPEFEMLKLANSLVRFSTIPFLMLRQQFQSTNRCQQFTHYYWEGGMKGVRKRVEWKGWGRWRPYFEAHCNHWTYNAAYTDTVQHLFYIWSVYSIPLPHVHVTFVCDVRTEKNQSVSRNID